MLGLDEAGRGPVLGPLVLCGVCLESTQLGALGALGVRDSKAFGSTDAGRARRAELARQIRDLAQVELEIAEADEIDRCSEMGGLNKLEQLLAARIIERCAAPERIVADGQRLFAPLTRRYPQLVALDKADATELTVAAASIVAKDERDRRFHALLAPAIAELGAVRGGGYPNAATAAFLQLHVERFGRLPAGVRQSWAWPVLAALQQRVGIATQRSAEQLGLLAD